MEFLSKSPDKTRKIGTRFVKGLSAKTCLIGLTGDLGSGKTTFVQGMAQGLGIDPRHYVTSPTFTIINEYGRAVQEPPLLVHVDLYRIEKPSEGETLAIDEYLERSNIVVVEWIERLPDLEKKMDFQVRFEMISGKERKIKIEELSCTT